MRFSDGDVEFAGQEWLWENALARAMSGKRGQKALRDLEQALVELPEKRLIDGRLSYKGEVCTVGALVVHRRVQQGESRESVLAQLEALISGNEDWVERSGWEAEEATISAARSVGVALTIACDLAYLNDCFYRATPEERYEKVLAWVRERIIEEPVAA
jgi:hypothetical protein